MEVIEFLRAVGASIREHRRARGLTQEQLAEVLETSAEWISQLERGVGTPSIETLVRVSNALEVGPVVLLARAGSGPGDQERVHLRKLADELPLAAIRVLVATGDALEVESTSLRHPDT